MCWVNVASVRAAGHLEAVLLGHHHLDQLPPAREQGVQQLDGLARQAPGRGSHPLRKARQGAGVDRVGLRQLAEGLGEVTHVARIHHDDRQSLAGRGSRDSRLVASSGLKDDQRRSEGREAAHQILNAHGIVGDGSGLSPRLDCQVEGILGDIDADEAIHDSPLGTIDTARPCVIRASGAPPTVRAQDDPPGGAPADPRAFRPQERTGYHRTKNLSPT